MFVVELVLPFLIFAPRRLRFFAAFGFLLLELSILITGNYNWFNLQTMLLCLTLFDDAALRSILPSRLPRLLQQKPHTPRPAVTAVVSAVALLLVFCSLVRMDQRFGGSPPEFARAVDGWFSPLQMVSAYGLFSIMTTKRREIVIEGSYDGAEWHEYEFRYKPGDVARPPPWNIPHQPRLDWQMWFAALETCEENPWLVNFLGRLLQGEPTVLRLLATNPFPTRPPRYIRTLLYDYRFTDWQTRRSTGAWWRRELQGPYCPVVSRDMLRETPGETPAHESRQY
jgi:hypothetical protein